MKHKKDLEISELRKQYEAEAEARDKFEQLKNQLEKDLAEVRRNLESEKRARVDAERSSAKADANLDELKSRSTTSQRGHSKLDKDRKKALKELRRLKERYEALTIEKDEQDRLAWKFQEEVDSLTEQLDLEHKARVNDEKTRQTIKRRTRFHQRSC